jgi:G3E family GTPase
VAKTPFTILTGWLGAGKTTALNRMLAAPHGRRIAVLVNELGRISIDTQLILHRGGDVLELAGGCVCCKVDTKNDLWDGIADVVARSGCEHVVLETTGIAEPAAILDGLAKRIEVRDRVACVGVACVVDAETGASALSSREEARAQAVTADRVLLAKLDVATAAAVRATHAHLDELAPSAERASFPRDDVGGLALTEWLLARREVTRRHVGADHDHDRHGQLVAVAFVDDAPLLGERVLAVIDGLGDRCVRVKGFLHVADDDRQAFVERAGLRTDLRFLDVWGDRPRRSEIVLIGELDEAAVRRALWACRAAGG